MRSLSSSSSKVNNQSHSFLIRCSFVSPNPFRECKLTLVGYRIARSGVEAWEVADVLGRAVVP